MVNILIKERCCFESRIKMLIFPFSTVPFTLSFADVFFSYPILIPLLGLLYLQTVFQKHILRALLLTRKKQTERVNASLMRVQENTKGCLLLKKKNKKKRRRKKIIGVYGENKGSAFLLSVAFQACSRIVEDIIL